MSRDNKRGGGVGLFVNDKFKHHVKEDLLSITTKVWDNDIVLNLFAISSPLSA